MLKNVFIPSQVKKGMFGLKKGFPKRYNVMGADVETLPYMLLGFEEHVISVDENNICKHFIELCDRYTKKGYNNTLWFHNLKFDLQVILKKYNEYFWENRFNIFFNKDYEEDKDGKIKVDVRFGSSVNVVITFSKNRTLFIYDTFQYFRESLKKVSISLNLEHKKLDEYNPNAEYEDFIKYLKNDVLCVKDLANYIVKEARELDIPISVSIAGNASKTLRRCFFHSDTWIPFLPRQYVRDIELSYHGGKNGFYLDKVSMVNDVYEIDISSAYPYALTMIPNFNRCEYEKVFSYNKDYVGVYVIEAEIKRTKYNIFYSHDFKVINEDFKKDKRDFDFSYKVYDDFIYVKNLRITSYELNLAINYDYVKIINIYGYRVIESEEHTYNPFKKFCEYFYEKKNVTPKKNPEYHFYKIKLNSVYGKTIENIDYDRVKTLVQNEYGDFEFEEKVYKAGVMYNPMLATLITGFTRAYITELEIKYGSLHTSTDSIKTLTSPKLISEIRGGLGGCELKADGNCLFFRNKCYIHFTDTDINFAFHGFHGRQKNHNGKMVIDLRDKEDRKYAVIENLIEMYINHSFDYEFERMGNIKESLKRKDESKQIKVCEMNKLKSTFKVKW